MDKYKMLDDSIWKPSLKARVYDPDELQSYRDQTAAGAFALLPLEKWWRDRSQFLESRGYRLRPRFRPGWQPSWIEGDLNPYFCEDGRSHKSLKVIDAVRLSDGSLVAIKRVSSSSSEIPICLMLSSPESLKDPTNHCVPILDHFVDDKELDLSYLVMPLLREFDDPAFYAKSEMLDFIGQTLEALVYIHGRRVAHRDLTDLNIMMDGNQLYPHGFHPSWRKLLPNNENFARPLRRIDVGPVKYFFVDFGISTYFPDSTLGCLVYGEDGQDQDVPELHSSGLYDPFKVDIFTLGNQYKKTFLNKYSNVEFLRPLIEAMMNPQPQHRPSAKQALDEFRVIEKSASTYSALWRLRYRKEAIVLRAFREAYSVYTVASFSIKHIFRKHRVLAAFMFPLSVVSLVLLRGPRQVMERIRMLFMGSNRSV